MVKNFLYITLLLFISTAAFAAHTPNANLVIKREKSRYHTDKLYAIAKRCTNRYDKLYEKLSNGEKITVFMDPAHGKLKSGKWQGDVTWRQSTTGKPEEFYSIPLSRALYKEFISNPYIRVATTRDYLRLLEGVSDEYKNISFTKTVSLATKTDSFIIVSSHLNNISPIHKAEGRVNMYGIHITYDKNGKRYLSNIKSVQRGFLTLYNKFDGTGFSRNYAEQLKSNLIDIDMYPNEWDDSVVADERFTYFSSYPLSVIYETAFISNPVEEKFLRIPENQKLIAKAQYNGFLSSLEEVFGVDISDGKVRKTFEQPDDLLDRMILSRFAVYYMKEGKIDEAIYTSNLIARKYSDDEKVSGYYEFLANKLTKSKKYLNLAKKHKKTKSSYSKYQLKAAKNLNGRHIFKNLRSQIYAERRKVMGISESSGTKEYAGRSLGAPPTFRPLSVKKERHSVQTPILLTLKPGQTLKDAIDSAVAPSEELQKSVYKAFSDVKITKTKWVRVYSNKKKKYNWRKKRYKVRKTFTPGIYIVNMTSNYVITNVKNVTRVSFDPSKYQNHEYFKNSAFAEKSKIKGI